MSTEHAISPHHSASVDASAGSGKTWLLVTRIIRLLLAGTPPANILALTFTRKAAGEMLERLSARLRDFVFADDATLNQQLQQIGLPATAEHRHNARNLYEAFLTSERPLRATTLHAFCADLLQTFPLEAGAPPDFTLLENPQHLRHHAWHTLLAEITAAPESDLNQQLKNLLANTGSHHSATKALNSFLDRRIDWWAFTAEQKNAADWASAQLAEQLELTTDADPLADFFTNPTLSAIQHYAALLAQHNTVTNLKTATTISHGLDESQPLTHRFSHLQTAFLTQKGALRKLNYSKALEKKLGADNAALIVAEHERLGNQILEIVDLQKRQQLLTTNHAIYTLGSAYLAHYQQQKRQQTALDFDDLEWLAYHLLTHQDDADWVQYKLDQRIDHLLIDEFQDTNPTQWRLLLPLLNNLADNNQERHRSAFIVGDAKQSIYRFRRADSRLLSSAADWLSNKLQAKQVPLNASWRSSPAIMDVVNAVFAEHPHLPDFPAHSTHLTEQWGEVSMLPLLADELPDDLDTLLDDADNTELRNPLTTPLTLTEDARAYAEGEQIAQAIQQLIAQHNPIYADDVVRATDYGDILILLRTRTQLAPLEHALRDAHIPFISADQDSFSSSLEIQDCLALLRFLSTPHDNLALAHTLRSPLFNASYQDLFALAEAPGNTWFERLQNHPTTSSALQLAQTTLPGWQQQAIKLPAHDLLDYLYAQGDLRNRFLAANPASLHPRIQHNLNHLMQLALNVDAGRYPSLPHFLHQLDLLGSDQHSPAPDMGDHVRILTIHAAKGLEAPIVFLAQANNIKEPKRAWEIFTDWPAAQPQPNHFLLLPGKDDIDTRTADKLALDTQAEQREDANLLYVALTRARQQLYISGSVNKKKSRAQSWYQIVAEQFPTPADNGHYHYHHHTQPAINHTVQPTNAPKLDIAPELQQPIALNLPATPNTPSGQIDHAASTANANHNAMQRGSAIHRLLELCAPQRYQTPLTLMAATTQVAHELALPVDDPQLQQWQQETAAVLTAPAFAPYFNPANFITAYNEVPINTTISNGVIDRLIITATDIYIIDYKTKRIPTNSTPAAIAAPYAQQLQAYSHSIRTLWPEKTVHNIVLLTAIQHGVELNAIT